MAGSGNILSATVVRPARGVTVNSAGTRPGIGAVAVPGEQGPIGPTAGAKAYQAATVLSGHRAVRALGDGSVAYASSDMPSHAGSVLGVTLGAAQAGALVTVETESTITEPSWTWLRGPVFLGPNGGLTQFPPNAGFIQIIGTAVAPTQLMVALGPAILL